LNSKTDTFGIFLWRLTALHLITYFIVGIIAMNLFSYEHLFSSGNLALLMKPLDSPWVALGPGFQIFRGLVFAIVLWPFKSVFLNTEYGWLKLWLLFIGLSILSTFGPAIGSIDGMIYTTIPIGRQILFLPELFSQSFLLSFGIYYWYRKPKRVFKIISIILVSLILLMSVAGFLSLNT
jgi:hypothetical protein